MFTVIAAAVAAIGSLVGGAMKAAHESNMFSWQNDYNRVEFERGKTDAIYGVYAQNEKIEGIVVAVAAIVVLIIIGFILLKK